VAKYCGDFLSHFGFNVNLLQHYENRASVLSCKKGIGKVPGVMVCAHMDTVPIGEAAWQHDPLGGDISDSKEHKSLDNLYFLSYFVYFVLRSVVI
jgi:succinyl-diaminopimelate desuccinylase